MAATTFESAIPDHLRADRTVPINMPEGFEPPFAAYSSRFPKKAAGLVMAIIGAQYSSEQHEKVKSGDAQKKLEGFASAENGPDYSQWAAVTDAQGFYNLVMVAYWPNKDAYETWATGSGFKAWWESTDPLEAGHGWFTEIFFPSVDRLETVFSHTGAPEGVAHLEESQAGPIREHTYWGSMRDRLPASQTDKLQGEKEAPRSTASDKERRRIRVHGQKNLAIIRSGQDLTTALPDELDLYRSGLAPALKRGMDFLRDQGDEVGCHNCRFMDVVTPSTRAADKQRTFGLAYFDDLASLESWSKEHPTHLAIFGGFMQYAQQLQGKISLRLFHEVLVLTPEQQWFEYVGCHPATGMLRTASDRVHDQRQLGNNRSSTVVAEREPVAAAAGLFASITGKFYQLLQAITPTFMTPTPLKAT